MNDRAQLPIAAEDRPGDICQRGTAEGAKHGPQPVLSSPACLWPVWQKGCKSRMCEHQAGPNGSYPLQRQSCLMGNLERL